MEAPTFADVLEARTRIAPHLPRTPLREYPPLSRLIDATVFVKHENHLPTGAFKVRGGVNLVSQLSEDERERGVVASSTGNHGQSIAFGARLFGVKATICVPENANPVKVAAMRDLGAEVVPNGVDFDEARELAEQLSIEHGFRYIHSGNEPHLIAGVATATLELLEDEPRIDTIIVPVGGGSGAAGCVDRRQDARSVDPRDRGAVGRSAGGIPLVARPLHCSRTRCGRSRKVSRRASRSSSRSGSCGSCSTTSSSSATTRSARRSA